MFKHLDGSNEDQLDAFCTGKPTVQRNAQGETPLEESHRLITERFQNSQEQNASLTQDSEYKEALLSTKSSENKNLLQTISALEEDNEQLRAKLDAMEAQAPKEEPPLQVVGLTMEIPDRDVSIKVLSGDGKIISAKNMVEKLKEMNLEVKRVDLAPGTDFSADVVFYDKANKDIADAITANIGETAKLKPLTWKSEFNIIIVTQNAEFVKEINEKANAEKKEVTKEEETIEENSK